MLAFFSFIFEAAIVWSNFFSFCLNEASLLSGDDITYEVLEKTVKSLQGRYAEQYCLCNRQYCLCNRQCWYLKWINALSIRIFGVSLLLKLPLEYFVLHSVGFHGSLGSIGLFISWGVMQIIISGDLEVIFDSTLVPLVFLSLLSEKRHMETLEQGSWKMNFDFPSSSTLGLLLFSLSCLVSGVPQGACICSFSLFI